MFLVLAIVVVREFYDSVLIVHCPHGGDMGQRFSSGSNWSDSCQLVEPGINTGRVRQSSPTAATQTRPDCRSKHL